MLALTLTGRTPLQRWWPYAGGHRGPGGAKRTQGLRRPPEQLLSREGAWPWPQVGAAGWRNAGAGRRRWVPRAVSAKHVVSAPG